jgi:aminoglycoside N3'-acetyltransferase
MGKNNDEYFDVCSTPSCVGIISDEFRKHPEVVRSLNPSHSMAVYGKKNFDWIKDHHKVRTMDFDSPLGKLESADGHALMISCPDSVTFMHVVEMTNNVHCLGQRSEEFNTRLPDGRIEKIRTWGWRGGTCQAYSRKAIYDYLRKHGLITEVMVRHSLWQFFKLSDYRKAYEKTVLRGKFGCMQCSVLPRQVKNTVPSDWDKTQQSPRKNTTAFIGDWTAE